MVRPYTVAFRIVFARGERALIGWPNPELAAEPLIILTFITGRLKDSTDSIGVHVREKRGKNWAVFVQRAGARCHGLLTFFTL